MENAKRGEAIRNLPAGWTARAANLADVPGVVDMMNARSQTLYGEDQATSSDVEAGWKHPRFDAKKDVCLVFDGRGDVAGIGEAGNPGEPYARIGVSGVLHPAYAQYDELWDALNAWALRRATEFVPQAAAGIRVAAVSTIAAQDYARRAGLERAGFNAVRVANHMRIDLTDDIAEPQCPKDIRLRAADPERDLRAIVCVIHEVLRDHWGFVEQPLEQTLQNWREGIKSEGEWFDPTVWFLACDGEEIAGMCICSTHIAGDGTRGYVQMLGVRPAWRERGIGLAFLRHAFREFRRRGYAAVELDMDSENLTGAARLYERAGMHAVRQSVTFEKELRAGTDPVTRSLKRRG